MAFQTGDAELHHLRRENERLRRAVEELSILNDLAAEIGGARDLEGVMQTVVRRSVRAVGVEQGVITLVDETRADPLKTLVRTRADAGEDPALRPHEHLLGWMQRYKAPLLLNDPPADPRFQQTPWPPSVRSILSVPMMVHARLIGILTLFNKKKRRPFSPEDARLLAILAAQSAQVIENARLAEERSRILQIFGQHTSPAVVDELLRSGPDVTSRRTPACVMFLDIRNFTTLSEQSPPEEVVAYLNTLFGFMIDEVNRHGGTTHQLLGDGFMALFGAPVSHGNDSRNAVDAALAILDRIRAACAKGEIPPTRVGIGLHAGEVVAGTVGSAIHREYRVTGDVVNVAARIEQMNKQFDAQLLISEAVWQSLDPGGYPARPMGAIALRGRTEKILLYRLA